MAGLICVAASALGQSAPPSLTSPGNSISQITSIPARTPVLFALKQPLSTRSAHAGDQVSFEVMEDVIGDHGAVVIQKGAVGYGHVKEVQAPRRMGRRATLTLTADRVQAINGMVPVQADQNVEAKGAAQAMAVRMTVTAAAVGIPAASLWLLKHGNNSDLAIGTAFPVVTSAEAQFDLRQYSQVPAGSPLLAYQLAFLRKDEAEMQKQFQLTRGLPEWSESLTAAQANTEAYYGHLKQAEEYLGQAAQSASGAGNPSRAAFWNALAALYQAELGSSETAKSQAKAAVKLEHGKDALVLAALALARSGDDSHACDLLDKAKKHSSDSAVLNDYWIPTIRAAILLKLHDPKSALKELQYIGQHEFDASQLLQLSTLYPCLLKGEAFLALHKPGEAIGEFKKITDHPGLVVNFPLAAIAQIHLARAYAIQGNHAEADAAYKAFAQSLKGADAGLPILERTREEREGAIRK
jgi:hypothetical protein